MRETRIKNQMDLQFFFLEITHGCNINREQEQIFMFKSYLKFPGTAEKQSQRQRPETAEAPLTLLWGRCLSTAYKSATSKRGRHSCQEYRFQPLGCFQHLVCILKSCTRTQPTEPHRLAGRQSRRGASVRSQPRGGEGTGRACPQQHFLQATTGHTCHQHACSSQKKGFQTPAREQRPASTPRIFVTPLVTRSAWNVGPKARIFNRNIPKNTTAQRLTRHTEPCDTLVYSCHPSPRAAGALPAAHAARGRLYA